MPNEPNVVLEEVKKLGETVETRITKLETGYKKDMKEFTETVKEHKDDNVIDKEALEIALGDILAKQQKEHEEKMSLPGGGTRTTESIPDFWKAGYNLDEVPEVGQVLTKGAAGLQAIYEAPAMNDNQKNFQELSLDRWLLESVGSLYYGSRGQKYPGFAETFPKFQKVWERYSTAYVQGETKADTDGLDLALIANWVPTGWSSTLRELIKIQLRVAALFDRITMPQSPFKLPVDMTDVLPDFVPEQQTIVSTTGDLLAQVIDDQAPTFTAKKLRSRFVITRELEEDAIIAMLPLLRKRLVQTLSNGLETGILNGDTAGTHQDFDTEQLPSTDCRRMILGLRAWCIDNSKTTDLGAASVDAADYMALRGSMGEFGIDPTPLVFIESMAHYIQMIKFTQVETVDKYGPAATILQGELGKIYGSSIVVSRYHRSNVHITGINETGQSNDRATIIAVHRDGFMIGDKREISIESERLLVTDQDQLVAFQRLDFQPIFGASSAAWLGFDVDPLT